MINNNFVSFQQCFVPVVHADLFIPHFLHLMFVVLLVESLWEKFVFQLLHYALLFIYCPAGHWPATFSVVPVSFRRMENFVI